MHLRILSLAALGLLAVAVPPAAPQIGGDKKKDDQAKKEPDITAETLVSGKNLDEWIKLISPPITNPDRSKTEMAIKAILNYPPEVAKKAVRPLIVELKKHPATALIDMNVRVNGAVALGLILSSVKEPDMAQVSDAVDLLQKMLKDDQVVVRMRACQALAQLGPMAKKTIPDLAKLAEDKKFSWELRDFAVKALGPVSWDKKESPPEVAVDALIAALKDSAFKVRLSALDALHRLRVAEIPASENDSRQRYIKALNTMANNDPEPICKLRAHVSVYLTYKDYADKKKRLPQIANFLESPDPLVRAEAVQVLGGFGAEAKDVLKQLDKMSVNDADPVLRLHAHVTIFPLLISAADKASRVAIIAKYLDHSEINARAEAAQALAHLGRD